MDYAGTRQTRSVVWRRRRSLGENSGCHFPLDKCVRHRLVGIDAPQPQPAEYLYREIASCALEAELARLTHTWELVAQAKHAAALMPVRVNDEPVSQKFRHIRRGGRLKENHLERLEAAYPSSRLRSCQEHRLAQLLCNPRLTRDQLMDWMRDLPRGLVRSTVVCDRLTLFSGFRVMSLKPWNSQSIERLVEIGSPASLFTLALRTRIAQLEGDAILCEHEESAIWRTLPRASAKSMALLLGSFAMYRAVDFFLSWEPYSEMRNSSPKGHPTPDVRLEAQTKLESLRKRAIHSRRIPATSLSNREERSRGVPVPPLQRLLERCFAFGRPDVHG